MFDDFKKFAFKGNIVSLAIGVVIGNAFNKIVSSAVADVIMPFFGYLTAGIDLKTLKLVLHPATLEGDKIIRPELVISYGDLLQNVIDFFIIALSIFLFMRFFQKIIRRDEKQNEQQTVTEIDLLQDIKNILADKNTAEEKEIYSKNNPTGVHFAPKRIKMGSQRIHLDKKSRIH